MKAFPVLPVTLAMALAFALSPPPLAAQETARDAFQTASPDTDPDAVQPAAPEPQRGAVKATAPETARETPPNSKPLRNASLLQIIKDFEENEPSAADVYGGDNAVYITNAVIQRVRASSQGIYAVTLDVPEEHALEKPVMSAAFECNILAPAYRPERLGAVKKYRRGDRRLFSGTFKEKDPFTITFSCTDVAALQAEISR
ncbi:MAG: hypothetical protein LBQ12_12595 [Deltaproteobacteria bacterium]|jgi:hypothetical protein|nr:hypothetical protein [Deltaproteobacteria bacterium]